VAGLVAAVIDLSNNNGTGHDFRRTFQSGQRRLYLKVSEGTGFTDHTYATLRREAIACGFLVGGYHFAHGAASPAEEADFFLARLAHPSSLVHELPPCLDLEYRTPGPSPRLGRWAIKFLAHVHAAIGRAPIIYGSPYYLEACAFPHPPAALWLAAYGRDDGREHPYHTPRPWRAIAAHQYADNATVPGIRGRCDISRVLDARAFELPRGN
jgi:lysozyme